jgi:Cys-tRNA(Pro)/Cys-tRNA(Cys) deacylase
MKKPFPTFIDESCLGFDYIYISAGQRGLQLRLSPNDLLAYTSAKTEKLTL